MPKTFKSKVKANIRDERSAAKNYRKLSAQASTKQDKATLRSIAKDESRHKKALGRIK